jgi:hypothetical protein
MRPCSLQRDDLSFAMHSTDAPAPALNSRPGPASNRRNSGPRSLLLFLLRAGVHLLLVELGTLRHQMTASLPRPFPASPDAACASDPCRGGGRNRPGSRIARWWRRLRSLGHVPTVRFIFLSKLLVRCYVKC